MLVKMQRLGSSGRGKESQVTNNRRACFFYSIPSCSDLGWATILKKHQPWSRKGHSITLTLSQPT